MKHTQKSHILQHPQLLSPFQSNSWIFQNPKTMNNELHTEKNKLHNNNTNKKPLIGFRFKIEKKN